MTTRGEANLLAVNPEVRVANATWARCFRERVERGYERPVRTLAAAAILACAASTPASAYWVCYPVSAPPLHLHHALHTMHHVARPTLRHHHHHHRICHVHLHCIWVADGGPAGYSSGDYGIGDDGVGYSSGASAAEGQGDADWFPMGDGSPLAPDTPALPWTPVFPWTPYSPPYTPPTPIPEPSTWTMLLIGAVAFFCLRRKTHC